MTDFTIASQNHRVNYYQTSPPPNEEKYSTTLPGNMNGRSVSQYDELPNPTALGSLRSLYAGAEDIASLHNNRVSEGSVYTETLSKTTEVAQEILGSPSEVKNDLPYPPSISTNHASTNSINHQQQATTEYETANAEGSFSLIQTPLREMEETALHIGTLWQNQKFKDVVQDIKSQPLTSHSLYAYKNILIDGQGNIYQKGEILGQGSFKTTYKVSLLAQNFDQLVSNPTHQAISITTPPIQNSTIVDPKQIKNEEEVNSYLIEAKKEGHDLSHVNVMRDVKPITVLDTHQAARAQPNRGIIAELFDGNVEKLLDKSSKPLTETQTRQVMAGMTKAIAQLHTINIVHRDIKPDNFLFKESSTGEFSVKVTDFGISTGLEEGQKFKDWNRFYRPIVDPSWNSTNVEQEKFSKASDIYQLGVCLFLTATQQTMESYTQEINHDLKANNQKLSEWKKNPQAWSGMQTMPEGPLKNMLLQMLDADPNKRPTADAVAQFFN